MDPVYLFWLYAIGVLVGGGIIGAILYRNLTPTVGLRRPTPSMRIRNSKNRGTIGMPNNNADPAARAISQIWPGCQTSNANVAIAAPTASMQNVSKNTLAATWP